MTEQMNKIKCEELMNTVITLLKDELVCNISQEECLIHLRFLNGQSFTLCLEESK